MEETSHVSLKTMQGINEMQIPYSQSFLPIWWPLLLSPVFWFFCSGNLLYFTLIHYFISYMTTNAILKSKRISSPVKSLRWSCSSRVAFWGTPEKIIFTIYIFEQNGKFMQQLKWNNLFLPQFVLSLSKAELIRNWWNFETNLILELLAVTLLTTSNSQEILDYKMFKLFPHIIRIQ